MWWNLYCFEAARRALGHGVVLGADEVLALPYGDGGEDDFAAALAVYAAKLRAKRDAYIERSLIPIPPVVPTVDVGSPCVVHATCTGNTCITVHHDRIRYEYSGADPDEKYSVKAICAGALPGERWSPGASLGVELAAIDAVESWDPKWEAHGVVQPAFGEDVGRFW